MASGKGVALVPLRGGSKSIPDKNIRPLCGKPLCAWTLSAALESGAFEEIYVSTDSEKIARTVRDTFGDRIRIIDRPAEFATDTASTESVLFDFMERVPFDWVCLIQATSPLTEARELADAARLLHSGKYDSLLSCVRTKRFFWSDDGKPQNYDPKQRPRRQDFAGTLMENGAFYLARREIVERERCRIGGRIGIVEMHEDSAHEIDEPADWAIIEELLARRTRHGRG
jgi:N-acylneuraminate cytidylyltransferase